MSCYNGFDVYRRDENGRLFYEEELSDYVCGRREANEIWQIGWSRTYASQGVPEKQIIFNKVLAQSVSVRTYVIDHSSVASVIAVSSFSTGFPVDDG